MDEELEQFLMEVGLAVNARCRSAFESSSDLTEEVNTSPADIIYKIDVEAEEVIVQLMEENAHRFGGIILLAEGIGEDDLSIYPDGLGQEDAQTKIICDPIDGSRGLMFAKRPAFFLGAGGKASAKKLSELDVSVMVELPIPKQSQWDILSARRGRGTNVNRYHENGQITKIDFKPDAKKSIEGGFCSFAKFCYPGKDFIAKVEELFFDALFANKEEEYLPAFDDQYIFEKYLFP